MSKKSSDSTVDKVKKQESKYDANVLRDLIRNGKTASEIMLAMDGKQCYGLTRNMPPSG